MTIKLRAKSPVDVPASDLRRAFIAFKPALRGQRLRISAAVVLGLLTTALELLRPWPVTWVIDHLIGTEDGSTVSLAPIYWFAAVAFLVPALLGIATEQLRVQVARVSRKATVRIRSDVFEHIQRLELREHQRYYTGDLLIRLMGDVNMLRDLLFPTWLSLLQRGTVFFGSAIVFALVDWRLLLVALIPLPLLWVNLTRTSTAVKSAAAKQRRKEGAIAAFASESLRHTRLIKAFAAEQRTADGFRSEARSAERATMAATRQAARMSRISETLTGAGLGLVLVLGSVRTRSGLITPGELVLAVSYTRMMYKPVRKLTAEGARVGKATACALRVMELLERPTEPEGEPSGGGPMGGSIDFCNVSHRYGDSRRSVEDFSCRIDGGSITAITGENGTGKSTLLALLLRLHKPDSGEILIGGSDISEVSLSDYRNQIAYVPQELSLLGGTIRDNIMFGKPEATEEEISAAIDLAQLRPVLQRLPEGMYTVLDEDGASLSGGQARRVMLARAALRDASLLLLDEPLSGLDSASRISVGAAITSIAAGRTTVVVHHGDLSVISPDAVITLDTVLGDDDELGDDDGLQTLSVVRR